MTDKKKKRVRKHAAKSGMSYQASLNVLYGAESSRAPAVDEQERCPQCDGPIQTELLLQTFQHGFVPDVVTLHVTAPVRRCTKCGFQYDTSETEELRAEAVRRATSAP